MKLNEYLKLRIFLWKIMNFSFLYVESLEYRTKNYIFIIISIT